MCIQKLIKILSISKFLVCADGFTGQKCETPCDGLFYGYLCSNSCECPKKHCHHIYGCRASMISFFSSD